MLHAFNASQRQHRTVQFIASRRRQRYGWKRREIRGAHGHQRKSLRWHNARSRCLWLAQRELRRSPPLRSSVPGSESVTTSVSVKITDSTSWFRDLLYDRRQLLPFPAQDQPSNIQTPFTLTSSHTVKAIPPRQAAFTNSVVASEIYTFRPIPLRR